MAQEGLPVSIAVKLFFLSLPWLITISLPMAILLGALLALSRLSSDNEILILKAMGVSFYAIFAPVFVLSLMAVFTTFYLNEYAVPRSNTLYQKILIDALAKENTVPLQKEHLFLKEFEGGELRRFFYARRFEGKNLRLVGVLDQEFNSGQLRQTILAREGYFLKGLWFFKDGTLHNFDSSGVLTETLHFNEYKMKLASTPKQMLSESKEPEQMTIKDLKKEAANLQKQGQDTTELMVQYHLRYAIPAACVIFALVGAPLGIRSQRAPSSIQVGGSSLIIFAYYVVLFVSSNTGARIFSPWLSAWLANLLFAAAGMGLVVRASR